MDQINNAIKLLSSTTGRDRIAKTLHYSARIVKWYFEKKGLQKNADQAEKFRQAIGNSRRVGRFFSTVYSIPSMVTALTDSKNAEADPLFRFLIFFADCCDALYYVSDNLTYMHNYGIVKLSDKSVDFWDNIIGSWTWIFSVVIWIAYDYKNYLRLQRKHSKLLSNKESKEEVLQVEDAMYNLKLNFIKNFADLQLAIYFCFPKTWPSHWVGVFGTINALTGAYQMWGK